MKNRSLLTLLSLSILLVLACNEDEPAPIDNGPWPCEDSHSAQMIDTWTNPIFDGGPNNCVDTNCIDFKLVLYEDSTYSLDYSLFISNFEPVELQSLSDTGTYNFICEARGTFSMRFTFPYIDGVLELNSMTEPFRALDTRWDGFWGLAINPEDLGFDYRARLLLQRGG